MLPEGAIFWVQKTPVLGAFIKILKVSLFASYRKNNFSPEHISPKCPITQLSLNFNLRKNRLFDFNGQIEMIDFYPGVFKKSVGVKLFNRFLWGQCPGTKF